MLGGYGQVKNADTEAQAVADAVKGAAEELLQKTWNTWTAVSYQTQVVNGVNYKIKVKVDNDSYVHLHAHKASSTGTITFSNAADGKTDSDSL
jgi:hypothetical protein